MRYKPKILIVDDDRAGRELLEALLPPTKFIRDSAESGADCLEKARSFNPDLVLLDVKMPDMDGFEVCRRLRREPGVTEIPVIMITAFDEPEARLRGIEAGADDFITKPFDCQELQARVRSITRLNRYRGLLAERERLHWVLDQSEDGFLILKRKRKKASAGFTPSNLQSLISCATG